MASVAPRIDNLEAGRNLIINGNFDFWQRGTTVNLSTSTLYVADRFAAAKSGTFAGTSVYSRSSTVPTLAQSGHTSLYSALITNGTGSTPLSGDVYFIRYVVEGQDYQGIHGKAVRFSFWVRSSIVGTYSMSFRNNTNDRTYLAPYIINVANTWEKKNIDLTMDTTGTYNFDNTGGLQILWTLSAGTTFQSSTVNQWQAGNFYNTPGSVNWAATTGATFQVAQVQITQASLDNNSEILFKRAGKTVSEELVYCQRYFEGNSTGSNRAITNASFANSQTNSFMVEKRAAPTVTIYGTGATPGFYDRDGIGNTAASAIGISTRGFILNVGAGLSGNFSYTADAEL